MTIHDAARSEADLVSAFLPAGHAAQITVRRSTDGEITRTVTTFDDHRRIDSERVFADPLRSPHFATVLADSPPEAVSVITMRLEADGSYYWMSEGHGRGRLGD